MDALLIFLQTPFLGQATWLWLLFLGIVLTVLTLDLGVFNRKDHVIGPAESVKAAAAYIALGLSFGAWIWYDLGSQKAVEYYTGYLLELTLALDNVFVISLILAYFAVPRELQHRVLFWGILGVIVLRAIMIGIGAALVTNFAWVLYIFAAFLLFTGAKMLKESFFSDAEEAKDLTDNAILKWLRGHLRVTETFQGSKFFVRQAHPATGKLVLYATPLFLALVLVEFADLVFAIDSVPAIFAITQDPYIVYTSNIFAILGLRALYFALENAVHRFHYLKVALALVLVFIGFKIFAGDLFFGGKFPAPWSLAITVSLLAGGVIFSLLKPKHPKGGVEGGIT
ncbi:TerC family protein [Phenylobacterium sp.]|uniref:TerC family protein n=1 Tax=Phenylobacterium sp. TaxID=1871053 RepID=UPI002730ACF3|nr:TerC family protein [Phenylobacterium sp.]MDP1617985.1 TerC family protein [Phenylobacterium sp.]MDP1986834.1 TerC family protein [Phenylobacterium sp.]